MLPNIYLALLLLVIYLRGIWATSGSALRDYSCFAQGSYAWQEFKPGLNKYKTKYDQLFPYH